MTVPSRFIEAAQACRRLVTKHTGRRREALLHLLADALCQADLFDAALDVLDEAMENAVDTAETSYWIARICAHAGRWAPALAALRNVPADSPVARRAGWLEQRIHLAAGSSGPAPAESMAACALWAASGESPWPADMRSPLRDVLWEAKPDAEHRAAWCNRLGQCVRIKVGLCWAEDPCHPDAHRRSLALADLAPLAAVPGVDFYVLQYGAAAGEAATEHDGLRLFHWPGVSSRPEEAASLIERLDLVISVDTAMADLSRRIGCPTWMLLGSQPHWRWLQLNADSDQLRIFRRGAEGGWAPVVQAAAAALVDFVAPRIAQRGGDTELLHAAGCSLRGDGNAAARGYVSMLERRPVLDAEWIAQFARFVLDHRRHALADVLELYRPRIAAPARWRIDDLRARVEARDGNSAFAYARWDALWKESMQQPIAVYRHYAQAARDAGDRARAASIARCGLEHAPDDPYLLALSAACGRRETIPALEAAVRLLPRHRGARWELAFVLLIHERIAEAKHHLQALVLAHPECHAGWSELGWLLAAHERSDLMAPCLRRAAALRPDCFSFNRLADALYSSGRHEEALVAIEQSLACDSDNVEALEGKALALLRMGREEVAASAFEAVVAVDPGHRHALFQLARLRNQEGHWLAAFRRLHATRDLALQAS